jgi:hypothetical protein
MKDQLFKAFPAKAKLANCASDTEARAAISRGATVGFYKSDCVVDTATTQTIFWSEF